MLTYWAVGLAYTPMLFKAMAEQAAAVAPSSEGGSAAPQAPDTGTRAVEADAVAGGLAGALAALTALTFALPVLTVASSLPGGLISAAIIGFGMHQAWRMTGVNRIEISGPYRIGAPPAPA